MDPERFRGKKAVVVGGSTRKGIGRSTAVRFLKEGMEHVFLVADRAEELQATAREIDGQEGRVTPVVADVSRTADCVRIVETAIRQGGRLDVLVNNVAAWTEESFLDMKEESWDRVVGVILKSSFLLGQQAARVMKEQGGGVILYTSSVSALGASKLFSHYAAAKAGVNNLVRNMAIELAPYRIRVNGVCPGPLNTQQSVDVCGEETMKKFREHFPLVPLGERLGEPDEIAATFAFLASDDASYITGQNIVVDGGLTAHAYSVPEGSE